MDERTKENRAMHTSNRKWLKDLKKTYAGSFVRKNVLELGSGTTEDLFVRSLFEKCRYVGVDRVGSAGGNRGVDIVAEAKNTAFRKNEFDVLISLSMFEHDPEWRQSLSHNLEWLRPGGHIFLCFGAEGNLHHGPEPWGQVPHRKFLEFCDTLPIEIKEAFFEENRYGISETPGVFNVVARKLPKMKKRETLPSRIIVEPVRRPKKSPAETVRGYIKLFTAISPATGVFLCLILALLASGRNPLQAFILMVLGYIGLRLTPKFSIPQIWKQENNPIASFIGILILGLASGMVFGFRDGVMPSGAISEAVSEEILFRLFFIPVFLYIFSFRQKQPVTLRLLTNALASSVFLSIGYALIFSASGEVMNIVFVSAALSYVSATVFLRYGILASVIYHTIYLLVMRYN